MKIFDKSILNLPLFDDGHRGLAARLEEWVEANASFAQEPDGAEVDDRSREITRRLGEDGWLDYVIDGRVIDGRAEQGRDRLDFRSVCLMREAFAYLGDLVDFSFAIQGLGGAPIAYYGTETQKSGYLGQFRSGAKIGSLALSEPAAGSNLAAIQTQAVKEGEVYVINGEKTWTSNGTIADYYCVLVRTGEGPGAMGLSFLLVPADAPGVSIKESIKLTAPRSFASLSFENCVVPAENLIGGSGKGFRYAMEILDRYRITVGSAAIGFCRKAAGAALSWSKTRQVFDAPLFDMQMTKDKLADMAVYLDAASLLVARAAWDVDVGGGKFSKQASVAKLYATEAAQKVIDDTVQIFGAAGLITNSTPEKLYRQIRSLRIYEGTSEIQKLIISGSLR